jgi:phenylpropionate dioxygenase-like ring-hydroxylating dioxygenase large terminal subunit
VARDVSDRLDTSTRDASADDDIHPGLRGSDYADPDIYDLEQERIFERSWFCIGREEEARSTGDYLVRDVGRETILAMRGKNGQLRAFYDVCRHRGSVLLDEPAGHLKGAAVVCPYHNWTYALDGELIGTPNVPASSGLDRASYGLREVRLDTWDGFVFVKLSDDPRTLLEQLAIEPDEPLAYDRYALGELRVAHRQTYEIVANWKIVHDNFNECLHCPGVHPELVKLVPMYRKGMVVDHDRPDLGATLADGAYTFTMSGTSDLPLLPNLTELDCRTYWGYSIFPNLMVNLVSTGVVTFTLYPKSATHTTLIAEYLYRPETIASEGFDCSDMIEFLDLVARQDWEVCERAQRGVGSKGFVQGVYPLADELLHRFAKRYIAERDAS